MVFFNYDKGVTANLIQAGGAYKDFYNAFVERMEREGKIAAKWEAEHPKQNKVIL
jgi:hypothetical protein